MTRSFLRKTAIVRNSNTVIFPTHELFSYKVYIWCVSEQDTMPIYIE